MKQTDENQVKAGTTNAIKTVVKAINTHIDNSDVCYTGCAALFSMVDGDSKKY